MVCLCGPGEDPSRGRRRQGEQGRGIGERGVKLSEPRVVVNPQVRAMVAKEAGREGAAPGQVLEALVRHGLTYRNAVRAKKERG